MYLAAIETYAIIEKSFPNNLHTLHQMAKCEIQVNKSDRAKVLFEKVLQLEE